MQYLPNGKSTLPESTMYLAHITRGKKYAGEQTNLYIQIFNAASFAACIEKLINACWNFSTYKKEIHGHCPGQFIRHALYLFSYYTKYNSLSILFSPFILTSVHMYDITFKIYTFINFSDAN